MKISVVSTGAQVVYEEFMQAINQSSSQGRNSASNISKAFAKALNTTTVADSISSATSYKDIFIEASRKYGVSYDLLTAMAQQESGFDPDAVSRSGAMGIMQIMPETARELGLEHPFDAYENIMAGAKYIAQKLQEFGGSVEKALAAYNAGSSVVKQYGGVPPYGETQSYVKNIKAIMKRGADVPYTNYISRTASKNQLEEDLKKLLRELPDTEEYAVLKQTLAEINYL
ncbi:MULTISPECIES: lytic transglycosylase domain-containing protein [Pseudobutyrivibrio]|uniref:Transglycosylase SLT domain-containing protein n=1 Tax=Pseudobutyrivibrio xylanivorans TaxID=185007 RepID=A0A1G5S2W4_PSEXY|nr:MULTISPECIES: lytic transglycosylase domain-containing protein [Pseudobutyrivibrio]MDC7280448.1 lytic transglycosylase domain-containing protein [Butyrivibrio fibrisolvens]SCZ80091.1 Transglycosylase SLT domain-containing protein [Pseudobutyrivibrio xylanivorans]